MQRKIVWIMSFSILGFIVAVLGGSYYLYFLDNGNEIAPAISNKERNGQKEFSNFLAQKKKLPQTNEEVSLVAVGDISYSRGVERAVKKQKDINYPFLKIQDYLKNADFVFGNLETPITKGREIADFEMVFRSNPGIEQALKEAGFSILSLANNHTLNFGEQGLKDTLKYLDTVGIKYIGAGKNEQEANQPIYIETKGIKFAFLAYGDQGLVPNYYEADKNRAGISFMKIEKMTEAVNDASKKADIIIVSMHSGVEYTNKPNDFQVNFAHAAISAGADLIIGHHPHIIQTMEEYKGKYIFYSLGNFIFDQPWSQKTKEGLMAKIYFTKNGISRISFLPVIIENFFQPRMANNNEMEDILQRLEFPLASKTIHFWDSKNDDFKKNYRAIIYAEIANNKNIATKKEQADLNNNLIQENYVLENGRLTITEKQIIIWQSPFEWWIDNFVLADSNNDGIVDINLSLWKAGDFGSSKPFWIKENDMSIKNHFFIYDFINGVMRQIWGSSNLEAPNCEFIFADIDSDGKNDLIVIEGDYSQEPKCDGNYVAVWKWNGWGFSNEWRSEKGEFNNLEIENIDKDKYF